MGGTVRALIATALLGVPLVLSGCSLDALRVVIPDFESNEILGVNVYQRVADTGDPDVDWERASRIFFHEPYVSEDGTELMDYSVTRETMDFEYSTQVSRSSEDADRVTIELLFDLEGQGVVRVTTFNAVGESLPSEETLSL